MTELSKRLSVDAVTLRTIKVQYKHFAITKRSGGMRTILAPSDELKALQRRILRRLLDKLKPHPAATAYEKGQSIVTNARDHCGMAVVIRMDIVDFFASTTTTEVVRYFRAIGWNREASNLLASLLTYDNGLPQGAPTSPKLANLLNIRMDARIAGAVARQAGNGAAYTRYSDDITISLMSDERSATQGLIEKVSIIVRQSGYRLHPKKKQHIYRRHHRQMVTGLVVNETVALPRRKRRWLRAVEHRLKHGHEVTLSNEQLSGWRSFSKMIEKQRVADDITPPPAASNSSRGH